MKEVIKVPRMGESISEATVGEIFLKEAAAVHADDEILELETDKVNQVVYASKTGILHLLVKKGEKVRVDQPLAEIQIGEVLSRSKEEIKLAPEPSKPLILSTDKIQYSKEDFAHELQAKTLKEPLPIPSKAKGGGSTRQKLSRIRKVIANRLLEVQAQTAMLTTFNEVDMTAILAARDKHKERFLKQNGVKLGFMSFFIKASLSALKAYPQVNSMIEGDDLVTFNYFDIGVAVGTEKGVFVPVLRGCDKMNFATIEHAIVEFSKKAKDGSIAPDDLQGGTFTITNGGVYGSLLSTPFLNPPQSAILGMHKIEKRPVVENDQIVIRPMMYLALTYDHRVIDGKEAVTFLVHIKDHLEDPTRLLLEEPL